MALKHENKIDNGFFSIFIHSTKIDQIKEQNIKLIRHKHQSQLYFDVFYDEMKHTITFKYLNI